MLLKGKSEWAGPQLSTLQWWDDLTQGRSQNPSVQSMRPCPSASIFALWPPLCLFPSCPLLWTHQLLCCFSNTPGTVPSQGLCICCPVCLRYSSSKSYSLVVHLQVLPKTTFSMRHSLANLSKISHTHVFHLTHQIVYLFFLRIVCPQKSSTRAGIFVSCSLPYPWCLETCLASVGLQ